ncbi:MAG: LacI family transcriptional regulator [Oscillospiraceae bacterium]|nr:LacI family transcriptional regulator [Oscillospiraceae bacterium]
MAATIRDVARLAGVSPSTVSRVLNQKGVISNETKQKIASAAEQLRYVPNDIARSFANGSAHAISLVIDISDGTAYANNFFNNTVFGIETAAHKNEYNLIITNGAAAFGGISSIERLIAGKKADGIVLPISLATDHLLRRIEDLSVPCVILGHSEEVGAEANWVDINNVQAGRKAVKLLLERGYQKIAFLSDGDKEVFNHDRIAGYYRELNANHLCVPYSGILHGFPTVESGIELVWELLQNENPPDAVICSDDRLALGALRGARQAGLRVPEQFGIISCDNTPLTELAEISITSVDVDTFALGLQAAKILINQIKDPQTSLRQILLPTKIVERASTRREKEEGMNV